MKNRGSVLLGMCMAVFLSGCVHRQNRSNVALTAGNKAAVLVHFAAASDDGQKDSIAVVDPAALKVGQMWKCETDISLYHYAVYIRRIGLNDVGFSAGQGVGKEMQGLFAGPLIMNEQVPRLELVLIHSPGRYGVSVTIVPAAKATALEAEAKKEGMAVVACTVFDPDTSNPQQ